MRTVAAAFFLLLLTPWAHAEGVSFDHSAWDTLLQHYVDDSGKVAYRDWAEHDANALDGYLAALEAADPSGWPREEQIAFWINSYNATLVRAVFEGYTAESLLGRYRIFSERPQGIANRSRTPDEIEKHILHGFNEPRIRFAIVAAAMSSPKLRRHAWTAATLKEDLDEAARDFLMDPTRNHLRIGDNPMHVSMIFKWYQNEFGGTDAGVLDFVTKHVDEATRGYLEEVKPDVDYILFDYTLNAQPNQRPE